MGAAKAASIGAAAVLLIGLAAAQTPPAASSPGYAPVAIDLQLPAWAPRLVEPVGNRSNAAKIELGRRLFYDGRLAYDGMRSCATCHKQELNFADSLALSWGVTGEQTARNAPALGNVGYAAALTWANPRMLHLEDQALGPMFGQHPVEMGMAGLEADMVFRVSSDPVYRDLFPKAFPETGGDVSIASITQALAAFERSLVSLNSPYDRFKHGDAKAISESAKRGEALFFGPRLKCGGCHSDINFAGPARYADAPDARQTYSNTGLYNLDGKGAYPLSNPGVAGQTGRAEDMGNFKTPGLRNIAVSAPYMHDGSIATLEGVLEHYAAGGRTTPVGEANAGNGAESPLKNPLVSGFDLSAQEKADVLAFLQALTDEGFLTDPRFGDPWKQDRAAQ